ncbi:zeaxanthin epoxidase, chloroplastic-like [Cornus florida]|uniref:zeaxanthin epoxidase, chloroplastic-like n=1 Tax=Cornus florida TaxID=4283 RepID=UPI00289CD05C|nr:zeaxanthin epoxidase, chloroplastic-like [Cornus florida]
MAALKCLASCNEYYQCAVKFSDFRVKKFGMRSYKIKCEERGCLDLDEEKGARKKPRILIAGGGIGGLVLALAAKHRGFEVKVFEKDLSAVRGEGQHRGPIQLSSNALAVLEAIDKDVMKQILKAGFASGNRTNGFADGLSGKWYAIK